MKKNRSKLQKKIQLRNEELANLSDAQFKTLVIRMLTELVEYGHKLEEKMKTMKSEIKENVQRTNSEGKETGIQINGLDQKEEIDIWPEQDEDTRIQKKKKKIRRGLGTSRTMLNVPTAES